MMHTMAGSTGLRGLDAHLRRVYPSPTNGRANQRRAGSLAALVYLVQQKVRAAAEFGIIARRYKDRLAERAVMRIRGGGKNFSDVLTFDD